MIKGAFRLFISFLLVFSAGTAGCSTKPRDVFHAQVSGFFYPASRSDLENLLNRFFRDVKEFKVKGQVYGVIAPHAGYIYSGSVAAYSFKALKHASPSTVIIMGVAHRYPFNGVAVLVKDAYETPLGIIRIDKKLAKRLVKEYPFVDLPQAFEKEHSVEVEIPFVQKIFPSVKIVLLLFSGPNFSIIEKAADILSRIISENPGQYVFVASSDLSHYHTYEIARSMDIPLLESISNGGMEEVYRKVMEGTYEMCGVGSVTAALIIAKNLGLQAYVLRYANSGDTAGSKDRVVGYGAVVFVKGGRVELSYDWKSAESKSEGGWIKGEELTEEDKKELLKIARRTLEEYVRKRTIPEFKPSSPRLFRNGAVFVTLKKNGVLRGCIGGLSAVEPLYLAVQHMTVNSCSKDPRFFPVRPEELKDITIEISVLSPPVPVKDPLREIKIGRDGLIIEYRGRRGVLLPQVPVEWGWDVNEFLRQICHKAGLMPDTWRKPGARLYRFTAVVFSETEMKK